MTNTRLRILVGLGCFINRVSDTLIHDDLEALVNSFMLDNEHGFIASFASTQVLETGEAIRVGLAFHEALETANRLGDAVLPAMAT